MLDEADTHVLCVPEDVDVAMLAAFVQGEGPIPTGVYWEDEETYFARGRVKFCKCGMLQCVCLKVRGHYEECRFRKALLSPVAIACDHGVYVCPTCDPCSCVGQVEALWTMRSLDGTLMGPNSKYAVWWRAEKASKEPKK